MTNLKALQELWSVLGALCDDPVVIGLSQTKVSNWSVGRQLDHILVSLDLMAKRVEELLRPDYESHTPGANRIGSWILANGHIPRGKAQAPEYVRPEPDPTEKALRGKLDRVIENWARLESRGDDIMVSTAASPHHVLGNFTAAEWVQFASIHTNHHLRIIRDITEGAGHTMPGSWNIPTQNYSESS